MASSVGGSRPSLRLSIVAAEYVPADLRFGLGAALIARRDPGAVMLVMPADHVIEPVQEFRRAAGVAVQMAEEHPQTLVTFGIPPTYPATACRRASGAPCTTRLASSTRLRTPSPSSAGSTPAGRSSYSARAWRRFTCWPWRPRRRRLTP